MNAELYDSLNGQVALVTGATRGIGEEIAAQLTELGATVYAGARNIDDISATSQRPVQLDVTNKTEIVTVADTIAEEAGRLDVLVNNAGIYGPSGSLDRLANSDIEKTLAVNLLGPITVCSSVLPLLIKQEGARIVNVSSGSGQFATGMSTNRAPYGISKTGLNALTSTLAGQYPDLIVNAVCPGWVRTDMGGSNATRSVQKGAETPVWLAQFLPGSPTGRFWRDKAVIEW